MKTSISVTVLSVIIITYLTLTYNRSPERPNLDSKPSLDKELIQDDQINKNPSSNSSDSIPTSPEQKASEDEIIFRKLAINPEETKYVADKFNLPAENVFESFIGDSIFTDTEVGDLVRLPIPENESIEMFVTKTQSDSGKTTIKGHLDGLDKGYGVSLIKRENYLSGYIIAPGFQYEIITMKGKTYLIKKPFSLEKNG